MSWAGAGPSGCAELDETIAFYKAKYPGSGVGVYTPADWARMLTAYRLVQGKTVLDIGVGNGALLQVMARSRRFDAITGADLKPHSQLQLPDGVRFETMSVAALRLPDASVDTVVCMEVLEHLETPDLEAALPELRRVARSRLIMTVPLEEPLPLWWHDRPGGHRQQFTRPRLRALFPTARAALQPRPGGVPWIFLVEGPATGGALQPLAQILDR